MRTLLFLALSTPGPASAAGLLSAPLVQLPPAAAQNAFMSLSLTLETAPGGQESLERFPELARLTSLNLTGLWGAGALNLLLEHAPQGLAESAALAARLDAPPEALARVDAQLARSRASAAEDVRRIAAAVERDLAESEYGIGDVTQLTRRTEELAGLAALDPSAAAARAKVAARRDALVVERARRVSAYLRTGAGDALAAQMGEAVLAAARETDPRDAGQALAYLERRGRLPGGLSPADPNYYYPPQRPDGEPRYFAPRIPISEESDASWWQPVMQTQGAVLSLAAAALRERLPGFAAGLFPDEKTAPSMLSMMLNLVTADLHLAFWKDLAERLGGLVANGAEVRAALLKAMSQRGEFRRDRSPEAAGPDGVREILASVADLLHELPDAVLDARQRRYRELKREQGRPAFPSLGF